MKQIRSYLPWIVSIGFLLLLPLAFPSPFIINNIIEILIGALFAISLNLLVGYTGLLSLGHNAFLGLGSYTMAILLRQASFGIPATLLGMFLVSGLFALVMGYLSTRLTKFYFAFLTLALSQIVYIAIVRWTSVTGGLQGLKGGIPMPPIHLFAWSMDISNSRLHFYYFTVILVFASFILCKAVVDSPFGWVLRSIRENTLRAQFIGINVRRFQVAVFVISGMFGALSGALTALNINGSYPEQAEWIRGADPIFMILIGGMNNFFGPLLGSVVMVFLNTILTTYTRFAPFFLGVILLLLVTVIRMGIIDFLVLKKGVLRKAVNSWKTTGLLSK